MALQYDTPDYVEKWDVVSGELRPCKNGDMVSIADYKRLYQALLDYKHAYEDATFGG